jgi:hypothetical protein
VQQLIERDRFAIHESLLGVELVNLK